MPNPTLLHRRSFDPASKFFTVTKPFTYNGHQYNRDDTFEAEQPGVSVRKLRLLWDNNNLTLNGDENPPQQKPIEKKTPKKTGIFFNPKVHSVVNEDRRWLVIDAVTKTPLFRVRSEIGKILEKAEVETEVMPDSIIEEVE